MFSQRVALLLTLSTSLLAQHGTGDEPYDPEVKPASEEAQEAVSKAVLLDGFQATLFAAEPLLANPVIFAIDERMRFYVAETFRLHAGVTDMRSHMNWLDDELACETVEDRLEMMRKHQGDKYDERHGTHHERIKVVWDEDEDGVADTATVYADGFSDPAAGIAAGLLPRGKDLYYACIPDLWLLVDEDEDGVSDYRESLHTGWGVKIALLGHDMHGLCRGPDGRLYWSIGDRGFHVEHEGKTFAHAHSGAVLRSEMDGSNLEIFATGLRNPQELCFDDHGNLWTGDNNSDGGDKARWTYVMEGAEIGWRHAFQYVNYPNSRGPWNAEKIWEPFHEGQPAYHLPCVANFSDGPSGLAYYPGTGFGPDWKGHFFLCDFRGAARSSGIHAFRVEPKGAGFSLVDPKKFVWNCLPTDVDFGADGNLYYTDWVNGWGMTGKGRILKVEGDDHGMERRKVQKIFERGFTTRSSAYLEGLLRHDNQRIRLEAQWELAERGQAHQFFTAAFDTEAPLVTRLHGFWGLAHFLRREPDSAEVIGYEILALAEDPEPEVRAHVWWLCGELGFEGALPGAQEALFDESLRVRSFAARALGQIGDPEAITTLIDLVADVDDQDPYLRHAAIWALRNLDPSGDVLSQLAEDLRPAVRRAAVVALRRLEHGGVANYLQDADASIQAEAARAIYDVPIAAGMPALAATLESLGPDSDHYHVRRALLANRYLGRDEDAGRIGRWLAGEPHPRAIHEALGILRDWQSPSSRDPMTGEWRPLEPRDAAAARPAIAAIHGAGLIDRMDEGCQRVWVALLRQNLDTDAAATLPGLVLDTNRSAHVRQEALAAALDSEALSANGLLESACAAEDGGVRAFAFGELSRRDPLTACALLSVALQSEDDGELTGALSALSRIDHERSTSTLRDAAGSARAVHHLEWLEALEARSLKPEELLPETLSSAHFALAGGNEHEGKKVFEHKTETSCLRCHAMAGAGGSEVGPDLSQVGSRLDRAALLESILDPNASVAPEFENWVFALDDGTVVTGRIQTETEDLIVVETPQKEVLELFPDEIEVRRRDVSSMPQDVGSHLSRRELRDLVAYLASRRE